MVKKVNLIMFKTYSQNKCVQNKFMAQKDCPVAEKEEKSGRERGRHGMTPAERKALKQAALDNDVSVSALIRMWLEKYQAEKEAGK